MNEYFINYIEWRSTHYRLVADGLWESNRYSWLRYTDSELERLYMDKFGNYYWLVQILTVDNRWENFAITYLSDCAYKVIEHIRRKRPELECKELWVSRISKEEFDLL